MPREVIVPHPYLHYFLFPDPSPGIGAACALALAQAGASLCLVYRPPAPNTDPDLDTLNSIRAIGRTAQVIYCDLSDTGAVKHLFQNALDLMGGQIHILVNCAGIQRRSPSVDFPEEDWDKVNRQFPLALHLFLISTPILLRSQ